MTASVRWILLVPLAASAEEPLYFSAGIGAESIHSQYDVPELIAAARIPPGVEAVNLGARNDHPLTIRAIAERVEPLLPPRGD